MNNNNFSKIKNLNLIFFGTSSFALPSLEELFKNNYSIKAVITKPDKLIGREKIINFSPVKASALKFNLNIFQPENLKNEHFYEDFLKLSPDLCIIAAYGKIIPKIYLEVPKFGFINIHPSLLPKYRGPTPIQTAILNGEKETGVTINLVDEEMDHGDIIKSRKIEIKNKNYQELERELANFGAKLLIETIPDYINGKIKPIPQDHSKATFTKKFVWQDGKIDWSKSAEEINRKIRALNPNPGTWTIWEIKEGKILKIIEGLPIQEKNDKIKIGQVFFTENKEAAIKCGFNTALLPKIIQLEGRKKNSIKEFLNGHPNFIGSTLS